MTGFFMHCCKKINYPILSIFKLYFSILTFCVATAAWAASNGAYVKSAELVSRDENYLLNADFDLAFSSEVEEALNKGVSLTFLVEFQLVSPRRYWFDDEIITTTNHITLSYHALSRQYLLNRNNHQQSFASLHEAKEELIHLHGWPVLDKSLLKKGEAYQAALRIRLDQSKLPKPLQVEALGSEDWKLVSEPFRWIPALSP